MRRHSEQGEGAWPVAGWWLAVLCCGLGGYAAVAEETASVQALGILQAGAVSQTDEASLEAPAPDDPNALLTYASVLFYEGQATLRGKDAATAEPIFRKAEQALFDAIRTSDHQDDSPSRRLLRGQCAYLLGDLNVFVFNDPAIGKALYEQALRYIPTHTAAQGALARLVFSAITAQAETADGNKKDQASPATPR